MNPSKVSFLLHSKRQPSKCFLEGGSQPRISSRYIKRETHSGSEFPGTARGPSAHSSPNLSKCQLYYPCIPGDTGRYREGETCQSAQGTAEPRSNTFSPEALVFSNWHCFITRGLRCPLSASLTPHLPHSPSLWPLASHSPHPLQPG